MIKIALSLPDAILSPNRAATCSTVRKKIARHHAKKSYREYALECTLRQVHNCTFDKNDKLKLTYTVFKESYQNYDWDNFAASMKAGQDGIFTALGLDDGQIEEGTVRKGGVHKEIGYVVVTIEKFI